MRSKLSRDLLTTVTVSDKISPLVREGERSKLPVSLVTQLDLDGRRDGDLLE